MCFCAKRTCRLRPSECNLSLSSPSLSPEAMCTEHTLSPPPFQLLPSSPSSALISDQTKEFIPSPSAFSHSLGIRFAKHCAILLLFLQQLSIPVLSISAASGQYVDSVCFSSTLSLSCLSFPLTPWLLAPEEKRRGPTTAPRVRENIEN